MGALLAIAIFVFPLALPLVTLGVLFFVAASLELGASVVAARAAVAVPLLALILGPGTVSTGAGGFLLPWWLHVAVGHSDVHYYVIHYVACCVVVLLVFVAGVAVWRRAAASSNKSRR